jgi:lysozyme
MNSAKEIIKFYESLELKAYVCPAGKLTIGFGMTFHYPSKKLVVEGESITPEQAEWQLDQHIDFLEKQIMRFVKVELLENQLQALISLCFNIGITNFKTSTLLKKINESDFEAAGKEFLRWVYATDSKTGKKIKLNGLVKRRKTESELFLKV